MNKDVGVIEIYLDCDDIDVLRLVVVCWVKILNWSDKYGWLLGLMVTAKQSWVKWWNVEVVGGAVSVIELVI